MLFVIIVGREATITTKKSRHRQIKIKILYSVCRRDQAAERTAPQGPPAAVPVAISATAFPPSTLA